MSETIAVMSGVVTSLALSRPQSSPGNRAPVVASRLCLCSCCVPSMLGCQSGPGGFGIKWCECGAHSPHNSDSQPTHLHSLTRSLALALALTFALDGQPLSFDNSRFLLLSSLLFLFCLLKLL